MSKYESQIKPWKEILKGKWVIFDADAVISITSFSQIDILNEMQKVVSGFAIIHPIQLELMNTNSPKMRLERSKLLVDFDFIELPFGTKELEGAGRIQRSMPISSQA